MNHWWCCTTHHQIHHHNRNLLSTTYLPRRMYNLFHRWTDPILLYMRWLLYQTMRIPTRIIITFSCSFPFSSPLARGVSPQQYFFFCDTSRLRRTPLARGELSHRFLYPTNVRRNKKNRRKNRAVGELENHIVIDPAAFMYSPTAPQPSHGEDDDAKNTEHLSDYDAFAPNDIGFLWPRTQSLRFMNIIPCFDFFCKVKN